MGGNESVEVTAGIWGFLVLFGLALACWFLFRSMNAHLRRVTFTERQEAERAQGAARAGMPAREGSTADTRGAVDDDPIGAPRA